MSGIPPVSSLVTGVSAWFLAACRQASGSQVRVDVLPGRRLRVASDAPALSAPPVDVDAALDVVLARRGWGFTDGRVDWPDLLEACADWEMVAVAGGVPTRLRGVGVSILERDESPRAASGASFTFAVDRERTTGAFDSPECLAALHAAARRWPDVQLVVKLPGVDRWREHSS